MKGKRWAGAIAGGLVAGLGITALPMAGERKSGEPPAVEGDAPHIVHRPDVREASKTNNAVDVPIVEPLQEALDAGPLGQYTLVETRSGEPFTPKGFYGMFKKACILADIPHCSPHGLRKSAARRCREAGCTDDEGMTITGHKSVRKYRRYAGEDARGDRADATMAKVMSNRSRKLDAAANQHAE